MPAAEEIAAMTLDFRSSVIASLKIGIENSKVTT
jgi:hypothetical protein